MRKRMQSKAIEKVEVNGKKGPPDQARQMHLLFLMCRNLSQKAITNSTFFQLATTDKFTLVLKPHSKSDSI